MGGGGIDKTRIIEGKDKTISGPSAATTVSTPPLRKATSHAT